MFEIQKDGDAGKMIALDLVGCINTFLSMIYEKISPLPPLDFNLWCIIGITVQMISNL